MKAILLMIIFISCASNQSERPIVKEAYNQPARTFEQKQKILQKIVRNHKEFDKPTRGKIESLLNNSLNKARNLQKRESQLISQIGRYTLVEKAKYDDLVALKLEMKNLYQQKYQNFDETITELKQIIGIKPDNSPFLEDMGNMDFFIRN